ncbi:hypothetical protein [Arcobacter sp. LA11]|uniref:hypothetical protein n=1 Tax=Arcobacter sp. LA11 TaxID=1898176 RepID=UPI0009342478|nr:hypothetical protein [Arcobacter sp. LA11]
MSVTEFLSIAKESKYNILDIYKQAPNEVLILIGVILFILLVIYFLIRRSIKISFAVKLVDKIQDSKSYDEYNEKISALVDELPKRGLKVADVLNASKDHILFRTSKLLANMSISDKIDKYLEVSQKYKQLADGSAKYKNQELTEFYDTKSKELLDINLNEEIAYYYQNTYFTSDEVNNVNRIIKYANTLEDSSTILTPMIDTINQFSYGYNLELFKFIEALDEKESKQVYKNCNEKVEELLTSGESEVSINILDYLLEKEENQKVYDYISSLKLSGYLQQLHDLYFNKKDDINLDLAFIANPTKINSEYKHYLDESLTSNWRDPEYIEFISKAPGVLEVLGHMEFRTLIERIDNISIENENRKMVEEALTIAKRAESIALEAKSLNKKPIIVPSTPSN